ncbi:sensor histidine kinase [Catellatospora sichuanensis]|uniref:sensor histidine kinase n=1 Tax=Catellatospora sichuanensis TaxID=1969805 RepID=UPI001182FDFA|nr:ATP-binding protein [Catellatospora sichuanensis]
MDRLRWPVRAAVVALVAGPLLAAYRSAPWELACLMIAGVLHVEVGLRLHRADHHRPAGLLLIASGVLWLLDAWGRAAAPELFAGGLLLSICYDPLLLHAILAVAPGGLRTAGDRHVVTVGYAYWPIILVALAAAHGPIGPDQLLAVRTVTYPAVGVALGFVLAWRIHQASPADRRVWLPFWAAVVGNGVCTTTLSTFFHTGPWPTVLYSVGGAMVPAAAAVCLHRLQRRELVEARDRERHRVERDVHDGVQQRLLTAAMMLRQNDPALVARGAAEVETAIAELRELVRGMNPSALVRYGLSAAVAALADRVGVRVAVHDRIRGVTIPEHVAAIVYFVTMEAVANADKHARAGQVTVTLAAEADRVEVVVGDDGVGGALPVPGGGLSGLRDRVESCGGTFRLSSLRGRGTAVRAVLPIGAGR